MASSSMTGSVGHMIYLDSISSSSSGGVTTYTLNCSDTNWTYHDGTTSTFTTTMVVNSSGTITTYHKRGSWYIIKVLLF